jgi:hypothetical protein
MNRILYCHCAFAKIVPADVKAAVLNGLSEANVEFDAVPDLCEMAARGDTRLRELAAETPLTIAACYPRAVKWLFAAAGAQLPEDARVWNMRVEPADAVIGGLLNRADTASDPSSTSARLQPGQSPPDPTWSCAAMRAAE